MHEVSFEYCELPATPFGFDEEKFKAGDPAQIERYNTSKVPNMKKKISDVDTANYARFVPEGCCFIDFDNRKEADEMYNIIVNSGVKCLILKTIKGYHFLFRAPTFYIKDMTKATNWFGYKFDTKANIGGKKCVQIMRVCGMSRIEVCSWDLDAHIFPTEMDLDHIDVLPYWLWGHTDSKELFKKGKTSTMTYTLTDNPFTNLMTMSTGGRHDFIVERCSFFACANGFLINEFKDIIRAINDRYLSKSGDKMTDSDMFGDLDKRWADYEGETLLSSGYTFDEGKRVWVKAKKKADDKIDERRAAEYVYSQLDCYVTDKLINGKYATILHRDKDGDYNYRNDVVERRKILRDLSDQNFKDTFFNEMEEQLMLMCVENNKTIARNDKYVIAKNKVMSCVSPDVFDFSWLGTKPPTDVVFPFNWYPEEWVNEHESDLGAIITRFIEQLSRDASGVPQPEVIEWLWVVAGASMIPANQLQKIVILSGGGQNGKSLYTSLIRLCLGADMFNESKIFDSSPNDSFWGENLDRGVLCVIDDLIRLYNRDAFSYIKGAITGTDTVVINEKFKPKRILSVLPQIIACTNFEFELYDKSDGMKRRVKILPTEYHVSDEDKDTDLQHKLVLNTTSKEDVVKYKMSGDAFSRKGVKVMNMYTDEKGVLNSLDNGSLAWFANKARYKYFKALSAGFMLKDSEAMKDRLDGTFSGGYDAELIDFLEWNVTEIHPERNVDESFIRRVLRLA